jgi:phosphoglycolate phosphatase
MTLVVFDLDHTLVRSPLDLAAMRAELRALAAAGGLPLAEAAPRWTVEQTIDAIARLAPDLRARCWEIVLDHEQRALAHAACEPGAPEALAALRSAGLPIAVWTNNARPATELALAQCELRAYVDTVVTRDEAALKPDPAGLRLLQAAYPARPIWMIGDSWVDGAAAQAGGVPFIAYAADPAELQRRGVVPRLHIGDLRALPRELAILRGTATDDDGRPV